MWIVDDSESSKRRQRRFVMAGGYGRYLPTYGTYLHTIPTYLPIYIRYLLENLKVASGSSGAAVALHNSCCRYLQLKATLLVDMLLVEMVMKLDSNMAFLKSNLLAQKLIFLKKNCTNQPTKVHR